MHIAALASAILSDPESNVSSINFFRLFILDMVYMSNILRFSCYLQFSCYLLTTYKHTQKGKALTKHSN